jgi:polyhydroxyalkanoate synthesis regulator phasin
MENKLSQITQDLAKGNITEQEARILLLDLLGSKNCIEKKVETKTGIWYLTDEEIKQWEYDGYIQKGDKVFTTILVKEY